MFVAIRGSERLTDASSKLLTTSTFLDDEGAPVKLLITGECTSPNREITSLNGAILPFKRRTTRSAPSHTRSTKYQVSCWSLAVYPSIWSRRFSSAPTVHCPLPAAEGRCPHSRLPTIYNHFAILHFQLYYGASASSYSANATDRLDLNS